MLLIKLLKSKKGSALIMAMICMILLTAMIGAMIQVSTSNFNYQKSEFSRIKGEYLTAETVERFRRELLEQFRQEGMGPTFFVGKVRDMVDNNSPEAGYFLEDNPQEYDLFDHPAEDGSLDGTVKTPTTAWISATSAADSSNGQWIEVIGSVVINGMNVQTRIRISFAPPSIYELAMLTRTVNCMCCHLEINGDMGTIGDFRPGWGREGGGGGNSGNNSYLNGNLYASGGYRTKENEDDPDILKNAVRDIDNTDSKQFSDYFLTRDRNTNVGPRNGDDFSVPQKVDPDAAFKLNGMQFNGDIFVEDASVGRKLPEREGSDKPRKFPTLDMDSIKVQAEGALSAGKGEGTSGKAYSGNSFPDLSVGAPDGTVIWSVPIGTTSNDKFKPNDSSQNLGKNTSALNNMEGYHNGHLILVGTKDNPIRVDGDLVVEGDVILKGYVEGRGTLYSGGNIYVAGDIVYADSKKYDPFRKADLDSDGIVSEEEKNDHARKLIEDGRSELRLGAKNNVVIGDWTYTNNTADSPEAFYGYRTFLRSQFGTNATHYFVKGSHGEEVVRRRDENGTWQYYNDRDEIVPSGQVKSITNNNDSYRAIFGTTNIKSDGGLHDWMSQSQYRKLLFTEVEKHQFVSYVVGKGSHEVQYKDKDGNKYLGPNPNRGKQGDELITYLTKNGITQDMAETITRQLNDNYENKKAVDQGDWAWRQEIVDGGRKHNVISIMIDNPTKPLKTDVGRVDGYIYASRRIAGHIYGKDFVVNGGMIGERIGVLAPGRRDFDWLPGRYGDALRKEHNTQMDEKWYQRNDWYDDGHSGRGGKLTVNYDYRLKNGGQSYDLLADAGTVIFWDKSVKRK